MTLRAKARLRAGDPRGLMDRVVAHLAEHGRVTAEEPDSHAIAFPFGCVGLALSEGALLLTASGQDLEGLLHARASLASHVIEFAGGERLDIVWTGDGSEVAAPPSYRELVVAGVETVTPRMRRVHFAADDLGRFAGLANIHVKLAFPAAGAAMPRPRLGANGLPLWPPDEPQPVWRKYTIRAIDTGRGTLAVDFVLHDHPGPGSAWALQASPGQRIGMSGPGGLGLAEAGWRLFIADETGLPAVARLLEALPAEAEGAAIIEVAEAGERQPLVHPPGFALTWLLRDDAGSPGLLDAAKAVALPDRPDLHVWAGAEFSVFQALRHHFREVVGLRPSQNLIVSYWRRGEALDA